MLLKQMLVKQTLIKQMRFEQQPLSPRRFNANTSLYAGLVLCSMLLGSPLVQAQCQSDPLRWGWEPWPPFVYQTDKMNMAGLDYELLTLLLEHAGCQLAVTEMSVPWRRQLAWIKSGQLDLLTGASYTAERDEYAHFSLPYRDESVALFIRREDIERFNVDSFEALLDTDFKGLGVYLGSYYGKPFQQVEDIPAFQALLQYGSDEKNLQRLVNRRLDGVLMDATSGLYTIKQLGLSSRITRHTALHYNTGHIHIMLSQKSVKPATLDAINKSLQTLRYSPHFQAILEKYGTQPE